MNADFQDRIEPNDPTRTGAPLMPGRGARLSRNEIEQLCLKAARGAGMTWGLAEEAGFAAVWLAARGIDGPAALLAQLQGASGGRWRDICPIMENGEFQAADGAILCPIALGAALCDHASLPQTALTTSPLRIGPVDHPILLLPFLAELARIQGVCLKLEWPQRSVLIGADGNVSGACRDLFQLDAFEGELSIHKGEPSPQPAAKDQLFVHSSILGGLNALALRTTVPASEASRAGAGAVASDND